MFGSDFFKIFHFIVELFRLIAEIFGDKNDKEGFENHLSKDREFLAKKVNASSKTRISNAC